MIYLFIGENYFRKKLLIAWKEHFAQKFSKHNIIHIGNVFDYEISFFEQNLLSNSFFSEKNLFIIDDFPFLNDEENSEKQKQIQEYFLKILPKISSQNIIVFNNLKADKRSKIYKEILKIGEIKDFTINDKIELTKKLQEIYFNKVPNDVINKMIDIKGLNFSNIKNELDKILIVKDFVDVKDLNLISKDVEENIFEIITDFLNENTKNAILKLRQLALFLDNPYLLYNSLASNLRLYFYVFELKLLHKTGTEIKEILNLGNRAFLVDRNFKINKTKFIQIYSKIASIDSKMKTGKLIGNENIDMIYEIERCFLI